MSPDPPREDSGDDENRIRRFSGEFIEGMMNDEEFFIVPDAPYELDMEPESEYSDSDEDGAGAAGGANFHSGGPNSSRTLQTVVTSVEENGQELVIHESQARGRYRLLIPFPTPVTTTNDDVTESASGGDGGVRDVEDAPQNASEISSNRSEGEDKNVPGEGPSSNSSQLSGETSDKPSSSGNAVPKREIELTDEKVEKIKEVMKNITLPSTSIPKWASEIDEDSWRKKLNDSISSGSKQVNKMDKNTQLREVP